MPQPIVTEDQWRTHGVDRDPGRSDARTDGREWLLTSGTGGYAMGTLAGVNTRRYHGLLVAAAAPPVGRVLALNQTLEQLVLSKDGKSQTVEFSTLAFRNDGQVHSPQGLNLLRRFERGLGVRWVYRWGDVEFERALHLHWKARAATLRYTVRGLSAQTGGATLRLAPMLTLRDFHSMLHRDQAGEFAIAIAGSRDRITVTRGGVAVTLACPGSAFTRTAEWWNRIYYDLDHERGQEDREDYFLPGWFEVALGKGAEHVVTLTVSLGEQAATPVQDDGDRARHLSPIAQALEPKAGDATLARALAIAADDFLCDRRIRGQTLSTILAGFPWFSDWGRDTFIALPGLLLSTGRHAEAQAVLKTFAAAIQDGLVPNRFDDYDDTAAHYNTVDASLWFIHAAMQYVHATGDRVAWRDWLAPACKSIVDAYIKGTRYDIRMTGDALISAGSKDTQLTWMDACCNGVAFTPRHGKAVEINALWYNALAGMAELLADDDRATANHYEKLTSRIRRSFGKVFWNDQHKCLFDHVWTDAENVEHRDASLRPNQVFAVSLPHSPIPRTRQVEVLKAVKSRLLTPYGLLTLPPDDPNYHAHYTGPQFDRDKAYHQGTIWPWLIGPYAEAVLRAGKFSAAAKKEARAAIQPLLDMMLGQGEHASLGQLHEIHEAHPPHRPVGCMAQAWSVAAVLHVLDLLSREPGKA